MYDCEYMSILAASDVRKRRSSKLLTVDFLSKMTVKVLPFFGAILRSHQKSVMEADAIATKVSGRGENFGLKIVKFVHPK